MCKKYRLKIMPPSQPTCSLKFNNTHIHQSYTLRRKDWLKLQQLPQAFNKIRSNNSNIQQNITLCNRHIFKLQPLHKFTIKVRFNNPHIYVPNPLCKKYRFNLMPPSKITNKIYMQQHFLLSNKYWLKQLQLSQTINKIRSNNANILINNPLSNKPKFKLVPQF